MIEELKIMKLSEYLETYEPDKLTKFFAWIQNHKLFGKKSLNELKQELSRLMEEDTDDLLINNINYAYFLKKEIQARMRNENT